MNIRSTISLRWYHCFHRTDFSWTTAEITLKLSQELLVPKCTCFPVQRNV